MSSYQVDSARMKKDLATLVAINTENPPGHEREAAECLEGWLLTAGFDLSFSEYAPGRTNVIAVLHNGPGPCFAFNTHIDTVPAGSGWASDPFTLCERDGRLYGRGACDAKGPLVAMIEALRLLAANRQRWSGTLMGVFTADEEVASEGAKFYVRDTPPAIDFAVIGEPTSNATFSAHKGSLRPRVRVKGVTAHSGTPELGVNAIYQSARLLGLIEEAHHQQVRCRCHDLVGNASLTVTRIHGGHADNVVPDSCELLLDRRMVPGKTKRLSKPNCNSFSTTRTRRQTWKRKLSPGSPPPAARRKPTAAKPLSSKALPPAAVTDSANPARLVFRAAATWCISVRWAQRAW